MSAQLSRSSKRSTGTRATTERGLKKSSLLSNRICANGEVEQSVVMVAVQCDVKRNDLHSPLRMMTRQISRLCHKVSAASVQSFVKVRPSTASCSTGRQCNNYKRVRLRQLRRDRVNHVASISSRSVVSAKPSRVTSSRSPTCSPGSLTKRQCSTTRIHRSRGPASRAADRLPAALLTARL